MFSENWLSVTGCLVVAIITLILLWIWNTKQIFKSVEKMGLKGPQPKFLVGNVMEMTAKGFHACFQDWEKQYGKVYGIYRAKNPAIVIHDPDILRDIMVKHFSAFPNRSLGTIADMWPWRSMLQVLRDDHWRHVRHTLSPGFSSGKLKVMLPIIQRRCENLVQHVQQKAERGEEVDTKARK